MLETIKREATTLGLHEAFLEAGPQLVLQLSIILRLGYFSKPICAQHVPNRTLHYVRYPDMKIKYLAQLRTTENSSIYIHEQGTNFVL